MNESTNRQVVLATRPVGIPQAEHFAIRERPVQQPAAGQVLIRNRYWSVEPAMRGWVNAVGNYSEPVAIGAVMRAFAAGEVIASASPRHAVGDLVTGQFGWQTHALVDADVIEHTITDTDLPLSAHLGVLGLNGITAYFGLLDLGRPQAGQTVVVSTAAGSVGSCVGQIAKLQGCRSVGIAGGAAKVGQCVEAFGYDAAIDYRNDDLDAALAAACPNGVDVYFDNTAGAISDAVHRHLAMHARVVICGTASVASWDPVPLGPRLERQILVKRASVHGLLVFDYRSRYAQAREALAGWIRDGHIRWREDILEGVASAPDAIAGLYRGENQGKRLIRVG
ncbi:MAG: NADP-dependent oxidoreductase [Burkholderiaceae bacterium]